MVVCVYKIHIFDDLFLALAIVAMITENMSFSHFYGNPCYGKISLSNHAAYLSRLSLEKIKLDRHSLLKEIRHKRVFCRSLLRSETLAAGSKCIRNYFF